jgi:CDP-glycerol glycerophosphotransferase (TagB/SpsB family)
MLYYIVKAITVPLKMILAYVSMLSIRDKNIIVFGAWDGNKFADNPKYLFLKALKVPSLKAYWITSNDEVYNELKSLQFPVLRYYSIKGIYFQLRAGACVICSHPGDVFIYLLGDAVHLNLWHGVSLKKVVFDDNISSTITKNSIHSFLFGIRHAIFKIPFSKEYVVSTSEAMSQIYLSAFRTTKNHILQLGQPRNDVFFDDSLELESFPYLNLYKTIYLYMPTHRNGGSVNINIPEIFNLTELNDYLIENDTLLLIKKHYYHREEIESSLVNFENIKDITSFDIDTQILLKYADVLISDYSSCYIDYLLLDRPIIFYNYDYENYLQNDRELYFPYEDVTPGPKVKNFNELITCLRAISKAKSDRYSSQRKEVLNLFYSSDNQYTTGDRLLNFLTGDISSTAEEETVDSAQDAIHNK